MSPNHAGVVQMGDAPSETHGVKIKKRSCVLHFSGNWKSRKSKIRNADKLKSQMDACVSEPRRRGSNGRCGLRDKWGQNKEALLHFSENWKNRKIENSKRRQVEKSDGRLCLRTTPAWFKWTMRPPIQMRSKYRSALALL